MLAYRSHKLRCAHSPFPNRLWPRDWIGLKKTALSSFFPCNDCEIEVLKTGILNTNKPYQKLFNHVYYTFKTHHWRGQAELHAYNRIQPGWSDFCSELGRDDFILNRILVYIHPISKITCFVHNT